MYLGVRFPHRAVGSDPSAVRGYARTAEAELATAIRVIEEVTAGAAPEAAD